MNKFIVTAGAALAVVVAAAIGTASVRADEAIHPVKTDGLKPLGTTWAKVNPYRGNKLAIKIGADAFNQNCARCHGLEAISGGIAPDLRFLPEGAEGDEWFAYRVQNGSVRDGRVYMPKMYPTLSQETLWAIRSWLDTVRQDN